MRLRRFFSNYPTRILVSSLLLWEAATGTAHAQSTTPSSCITAPVIVPGLSGPPNWFGEPASATNPSGSRPELDDPRWAGSPLMPFQGAIAGSSPTFRILRGANPNYLYLSFHVPVSASGSDRIYFGFSEGIGTGDPLSVPAYLLEIQPAPGGTVDPISTPVLQIQKYTPNVGWASDATPGWVQNVSTWRSPETGLAFGMNFRIAFTTTGPTTNEQVFIPGTKAFRAFFGAGLRVEPAHTIEYSMPPVSPTTTFINTGIHVPDKFTEWALFQGATVACREGVTIDSYNIHTGHPNGCSLYTGDPISQNTFIVEPQSIRGNSPEQFDQHIVRVQLSLAEWGAVDVDAQTNWRVIDGTKDGLKSSGTWTWDWHPSPTGPSSTALGSATIGFTCALGGNAYCPTLNLADPGSVTPPEIVNQAVLATLSVAQGVPDNDRVRIKRGAAFMNMIPIGLSEDKRKAIISLRGQPKPKDPKQTQRDVYLKIVRRNMPPHGDAMIAPPLEQMKRVFGYIRNPGPSPFVLAPLPAEPTGAKGAIEQQKAAAPSRGNYGKPQKPGETPPADKPKDPPKQKDEPAVTLPETLPLEYSSATQHELVSRALPVYEVHAYYETGETIPDKRGKPRKALKALAPFGYVLNHDTPFYGFTGAIKGVGSSLDEVQEGLYKVSVPVDGSIQIETTIRAEEKPLHADCCNQKPPVVHVHVSPRGCYCATPGSGGDGSKLLPLAVLPAALLIWRRKRRSKA